MPGFEPSTVALLRRPCYPYTTYSIQLFFTTLIFFVNKKTPSRARGYLILHLVKEHYTGTPGLMLKIPK